VEPDGIKSLWGLPPEDAPGLAEAGGDPTAGRSCAQLLDQRQLVHG
jgi:hypothetical protein